MNELIVDYCGERHTVEPGRTFTIGRTADLVIDENPYLHRVFLEVRAERDMWVLANVGSQLSATISDGDRLFVAHLAPGGVLPIVFDRSFVRFGAGATTYEFLVELAEPPFDPAPSDEIVDDDALGATTRTPADLTPDQRRLVLALAEPALRLAGTGPSALPTTADAAARLGWTTKKFNKKLDQLCHKLADSGVRGLHGEPGALASNRRARLVEYCLSGRILTADDLTLLDAAPPA